MEEIRSIVASLPQRELDIRRRWRCDAQFRAICEDYEEAASALRYWQKQDAKDRDRMVQEYTDLAAELEAEILALLDRPMPISQCS